MIGTKKFKNPKSHSQVQIKSSFKNKKEKVKTKIKGSFWNQELENACLNFINGV